MTFVTLHPQHPHCYTLTQIIDSESGLSTHGENSKSNTRTAQVLTNVRIVKKTSMTYHMESQPWSKRRLYC